MVREKVKGWFRGFPNSGTYYRADRKGRGGKRDACQIKWPPNEERTLIQKGRSEEAIKKKPLTGRIQGGKSTACRSIGKGGDRDKKTKSRLDGGGIASPKEDVEG